MPLSRIAVERILLVLLYLLAIPCYLIALSFRFVRLLKQARAVKRGIVTCKTCGTANSLFRLAECRRCNFTEFGSVLVCSGCGLISSVIRCEGCGASLRVWR